MRERRASNRAPADVAMGSFRGLSRHYTQGPWLLEGVPHACYAPRSSAEGEMADEEPFKVTDRRGRAREFASSEPAAAASPIDAPSSPPLVDAGSRAERAPRSETGPPVGAGARPSAVPPDLQQLFIMFTSSALINMGEAADPGSGERHVDLDQAREAIDVLVLLRDKTQGNRSEEESRLLEDVLYDLQMRFVRVARGSRP